MWTYVQATGQLFAPDGKEAGTGYAGLGSSKNKPEDQCKQDAGPLPCNTYTIEPEMTHPDLGPMALPLTPHYPSMMCNRSGFYIHGDSRAHPGDASKGCIVIDLAVRERVSQSQDRLLRVIARPMVQSEAATKPLPASTIIDAPNGLGTAAALVLAAAFIHWIVPDAQLAIFFGWLLCAGAAALVVRAAPGAIINEVGRPDAAHLFTIAWFVLLASAMASGSLWNVMTYAYKVNTPLAAFVSIPKDVWVLGGITLVSNLGVRAAFATSQKLMKYVVQPSTNGVVALMSPPLDESGAASMSTAQYVIFNLIGVIVYGVAIARIFGTLPAGQMVPAFPTIPAEVLSLMGVSGAGLVLSNAVPLLRK